MDRAYVLERLVNERRHAANAFEWVRVGELDEQIARLSSASQTANPARETTTARNPAQNKRSTRVVRK